MNIKEKPLRTYSAEYDLDVWFWQVATAGSWGDEHTDFNEHTSGVPGGQREGGTGSSRGGQEFNPN
jgi:hypothetical protein